jgi:excinuclease ABC subunit C
MARTNAELGLKMKASSRATVATQLAALADDLGLDKVPERIECFDVSHTMGESAIAACVVLGPEGPLKADYRRFNLDGLTPGDDYGDWGRPSRGTSRACCAATVDARCVVDRRGAPAAGRA